MLNKNFLLSPEPLFPSERDKQYISGLEHILTKYFFIKVFLGEPFGATERIKKEFGKSLEEKYGLQTGAFLNMAKTYWTYRLEVDDLFPNYHNLVLTRILKNIETNISGLFFPTPGIIEIPLKQRMEAQRQLLNKLAPQIDVEQFLADNPMFKRRSPKDGDKKEKIVSGFRMGKSPAYWLGLAIGLFVFLFFADSISFWPRSILAGLTFAAATTLIEWIWEKLPNE